MATNLRLFNPKTAAIVALAGAVAALLAFLLLNIVGGFQEAKGPIEISEMVRVLTPGAEGESVVITPAIAITPEGVSADDLDKPQPDLVAPIIEETPVAAGELLLHTVQDGENMFRISLRYGVSIEEILLFNGLTDASLISAGQILQIPTSLFSEGSSAPAARAPVLGTETPTITPSPTHTPIPPPPTSLNGLDVDSFIVLSPEAIAMARSIFARGQELGINPRAYSKVGDSTIESPHFMGAFDGGEYDLASFAYLQTVINHFAGSHERQGVAVRRGFHSWTVTDPAWADKTLCQPNESPVACEIRINRPAFLLVRLGSNDSGASSHFDDNVRQVVEFAIEQGVVPIIGTKADRFEGEGNINNEILRKIANDYQLPLWDFDVIAETLPNRGLYLNDVHLTLYTDNDYGEVRAFQTGHGVHNLTALMMLDALLKNVVGPAVGYEE